MTENAAATQSGRSGNALIGSDRVEGTKVFDPAGKQNGTIKSIVIDKVSGRVAYAIMSFGGFLGLGAHEHAVPWNKLTYDTSRNGYRTDITQEQLEKAPSYYRASAGGVGTGRRPESDTGTQTADADDYGYGLSDRNGERELHDYYAVAYYWEE
jgi:hypothetical protein